MDEDDRSLLDGLRSGVDVARDAAGVLSPFPVDAYEPANEFGELQLERSTGESILPGWKADSGENRAAEYRQRRQRIQTTLVKARAKSWVEGSDLVPDRFAPELDRTDAQIALKDAELLDEVLRREARLQRFDAVDAHPDAERFEDLDDERLFVDEQNRDGLRRLHPGAHDETYLDARGWDHDEENGTMDRTEFDPEALATVLEEAGESIDDLMRGRLAGQRAVTELRAESIEADWRDEFDRVDEAAAEMGFDESDREASADRETLDGPVPVSDDVTRLDPDDEPQGVTAKPDAEVDPGERDTERGR